MTGSGAAPGSRLVTSTDRGLGGRLFSLRVLGGRRWGEGRPGGLTLHLGVRLEASLSWQHSTLEPESGEEAACQDFRQSWCDHSQLRRFQVGNIVRAVLARHHGGAELEERGGWGAGAGGWGKALLHGAVACGVLDSVVPALYSLDGAGVSATGPGRRVGESRVRKPGGKTARKEGEVSRALGKKGAGVRVRPREDERGQSPDAAGLHGAAV